MNREKKRKRRCPTFVYKGFPYIRKGTPIHKPIFYEKNMAINFNQISFNGAVPQKSIPDASLYLGLDSEYDSHDKLVCTQRLS